MPMTQHYNIVKKAILYSGPYQIARPYHVAKQYGGNESTVAQNDY